MILGKPLFGGLPNNTDKKQLELIFEFFGTPTKDEFPSIDKYPDSKVIIIFFIIYNNNKNNKNNKIIKIINIIKKIKKIVDEIEEKYKGIDLDEEFKNFDKDGIDLLKNLTV
jgi:hypothetical protein